MTEWSPKQYLLFADQRTQPAADLAARVAGRAGRAGGTGKTVRTAVDVGCGPGNSTAVLRHTFPEARLLGVDLSPEMVERAARQYPEIAFRVGDAASLTGQYDLIFSNACLQWVPQHETLIPGLMERLTSGGVLAVQMPMNDDEPFYRIIREVIEDAKWGFHGVEGDFTALNWRPTQPARRRNTSTYCPAARRALICGNANIITDCPTIGRLSNGFGVRGCVRTSPASTKPAVRRWRTSFWRAPPRRIR